MYIVYKNLSTTGEHHTKQIHYKLTKKNINIFVIDYSKTHIPFSDKFFLSLKMYQNVCIQTNLYNFKMLKRFLAKHLLFRIEVFSEEIQTKDCPYISINNYFILFMKKLRKASKISLGFLEHFLNKVWK